MLPNFSLCGKHSNCGWFFAALVDGVLNAETLKWKFSLDLIKLCMIQRIFTMLRVNTSGAPGL